MATEEPVVATEPVPEPAANAEATDAAETVKAKEPKAKKPSKPRKLSAYPKYEEVIVDSMLDLFQLTLCLLFV